LAQESFETYRTAMLEAARFDPAFKPEQWNPVECLPMPQPATLDPPDMADMARQLAMESRYRSRNPQRDYEVLQLRLDGMNYREIGLEVGISGTHAWRIVNRQMGMAGAL
jgi:DNA-directed RNA polymerase specialized sigma24 family protein